MSAGARTASGSTSPSSDNRASTRTAKTGYAGGARRYPLGVVRIATWNVNSAKIRVPRLLPWLDERRPDVVCLQETKLGNEAFIELLGEELRKRDYEIALHGEAQWNGVALLSRVGMLDVVTGVTGAPGFPL